MPEGIDGRPEQGVPWAETVGEEGSKGTLEPWQLFVADASWLPGPFRASSGWHEVVEILLRGRGVRVAKRVGFRNSLHGSWEDKLRANVDPVSISVQCSHPCDAVSDLIFS
jgi:hypothetical protein